MKSYTWQYNDDVRVRFSTRQAVIHPYDEPGITVKFRQPNEDRLGLYNAKITADRMRELGYDFNGRIVIGIKAMRENVPFQRTLSEIEARNRTAIAHSVHGYLIQIPLATDTEKVIAFMRDNNIRWY